MDYCGAKKSRRKNMENSKNEEAENLAAPSTPDNTEKKKRFAGNNAENEEAESWGPFEHVEPRTPDSNGERELQRFGHHQPNTPPSIGK